MTIEAQKGLVLHGYVEDSFQFMSEHGILVAPVRTGSGIRIKMLEALTLGIPCITTTTGAMGIGTPEEILIVANTDEEWINAMSELAESQELRTRLGQKAKRYMEKYHSFAAINTQIRHALEK
jgi:glycosyltransferase involved in cell wall biosynthesis